WGEVVWSAITRVDAILPVLAPFARVVRPFKLIAFAMDNENHANGCECGRNDKDKNPAAQCLNHSSACGSRLSIAERAALGKSRHGRQQQDQSRQRDADK